MEQPRTRWFRQVLDDKRERTGKKSEREDCGKEEETRDFSFTDP